MKILKLVDHCGLVCAELRHLPEDSMEELRFGLPLERATARGLIPGDIVEVTILVSPVNGQN